MKKQTRYQIIKGKKVTWEFQSDVDKDEIRKSLSKGCRLKIVKWHTIRFVLYVIHRSKLYE
jgi:hypothetical protein